MSLTDSTKSLCAGVLGVDVLPRDIRYDDKGEPYALAVPVENLLIRFIRDRGEDFLDVAGIHRPDEFFQSDVLEIAFGWRTIDDTLRKRTPGPVSDILGRLRDHMDELVTAFDRNHLAATLDKLSHAQSSKAEALAARLR